MEGFREPRASRSAANGRFGGADFLDQVGRGADFARGIGQDVAVHLGLPGVGDGQPRHILVSLPTMAPTVMFGTPRLMALVKAALTKSPICTKQDSSSLGNWRMANFRCARRW